MATAICFASLNPSRYTQTPGTSICNSAINKKLHSTIDVFQTSPCTTNNHSLICKATGPGGVQSTKPNSVICADCDGNGAVQCSQCKGDGVNSVDLFNGQFKAGDSCWLCGGKKEILCGNCNGAGFVGGFLSTYDE